MADHKKGAKKKKKESAAVVKTEDEELFAFTSDCALLTNALQLPKD